MHCYDSIRAGNGRERAQSEGSCPESGQIFAYRRMDAVACRVTEAGERRSPLFFHNGSAVARLARRSFKGFCPDSGHDPV